MALRLAVVAVIAAVVAMVADVHATRFPNGPCDPNEDPYIYGNPNHPIITCNYMLNRTYNGTYCDIDPRCLGSDGKWSATRCDKGLCPNPQIAIEFAKQGWLYKNNSACHHRDLGPTSIPLVCPQCVNLGACKQYCQDTDDCAGITWRPKRNPLNNETISVSSTGLINSVPRQEWSEYAEDVPGVCGELNYGSAIFLCDVKGGIGWGGGSDVLLLTSRSTTSTTATTTTVTPPPKECGSRTYKGCYDNQANRVDGHIVNKNMAECQELARERGKSWFGMEFPHGATSKDAAGCLMFDEDKLNEWTNGARRDDTECNDRPQTNGDLLGGTFRIAVYTFGAHGNQQAGCVPPTEPIKYTHVVGMDGRTFANIESAMGIGATNVGLPTGAYIDANSGSPVDGKVVGYEYIAVFKRPFIVRHYRVANNRPDIDVENLGGMGLEDNQCGAPEPDTPDFNGCISPARQCPWAHKWNGTHGEQDPNTFSSSWNGSPGPFDLPTTRARMNLSRYDTYQAASFSHVGTNYINNKRLGHVFVGLPPDRQIHIKKGDVVGASSGGHAQVQKSMWPDYKGPDLLPLAYTHDRTTKQHLHYSGYQGRGLGRGAYIGVTDSSTKDWFHNFALRYYVMESCNCNVSTTPTTTTRTETTSTSTTITTVTTDPNATTCDKSAPADAPIVQGFCYERQGTCSTGRLNAGSRINQCRPELPNPNWANGGHLEGKINGQLIVNLNL